MCHNNQAGVRHSRITEGGLEGEGEAEAGAVAGAAACSIVGVKVTHGNSHKMTLSVSFN